MKIVVVNGCEKHGCTYQIKQIFLQRFRDKAEITEWYLPKDMPSFCCGSANCVIKGESSCKDYEYSLKIWQSMQQADLIVFTSPVYVMRATGAMKALLDHFAVHWMSHRPDALMFQKRAIVITQALGAGVGAAAKDISTSLSWWGIPYIKKLKIQLFQNIIWKELTESRRKKITKKTDSLAKKLSKVKYEKKPHVTISVKFKFLMCRFLQKTICKKHSASVDSNYWLENGWLKRNRPWKAK